MARTEKIEMEKSRWPWQLVFEAVRAMQTRA